MNEEIEYLNYLKDKISFRLKNKATATGYKQCLKRIDIINKEIDKLTKAVKAAKKGH